MKYYESKPKIRYILDTIKIIFFYLFIIYYTLDIFVDLEHDFY